MTTSLPKTPSVYTARLKVSNYIFPPVDGSANQCLVTDGAGTLTFGNIGAFSSIINGTGTNDRLVRWDVSNDIQSSTVALSDAGDLSGVSSINVAGITYPTVDGTLNQALLTDGVGTLSFGNIVDVSGIITGTGTSDRLVRWDVSNNVQSSTVALSDAGDLSGVSSLNVAAITYPTTDGTPNQALLTNGAGTLSFGNIIDASGVIIGTGTNDRLVRWDVSNNVQSSTVALNDAGDLSGVSSLNVASIAYPTTDGSPNQALLTNGAGTLSFGNIVDVSGIISGTGTNDRLVRWDVSNNVQSSTVALNDAGDLSGILSLNVATITYPTSDGTTNQALVTNGAGILSFGNIVDVSGVIHGSGTNDRLVRWDVSNNIQSSTVTLNDAGDLSGGTRLHFSGNTQIATSSLYFDFSNTDTVFAGTTDCCGSLIHTGLLGSSTQCIINDSSQTAMMSSKLSNITSSVNSMVIGSDSCSLTNNSTFCDIQNSISSTITNSTKSYIMCSASSNISNNSFTSISTTDQGEIIDCSYSLMMSSRQSKISDSHHSCVFGSTGAEINNSIYSSIISSIDCSLASNRVTVMACRNVADNNGIQNASFASEGLNSTDSQYTTMVACLSCIVNNVIQCSLFASELCTIDQSTFLYRNQMLSSYGINQTPATSPPHNSVWGGVFSRTWLINSATGTYYGLVGAIDTAVPDFAEYFENMYTEIIPVGTLVTLDQGKVRVALSNEYVMGVVSAQPGLVGGGCNMNWQGAWKKDEWGRYETQLMVEPTWSPGPGQTMADAPTSTVLVPNPEYDPTLAYIPRKDRPTEWTVVGLKGQVVTRVDANVVPNDFIEPGDSGVGTTSAAKSKVQCMKINFPFDIQKGYAMALCYIK